MKTACCKPFAVLFACAALVAGLLCGGQAQAKDMPAVAFAPGATSASVKGEIVGGDRDIYPVAAKAGQTMKVVLKNKVKALLFHIQVPGDQQAYVPGAGPDDDATTWQGKLPKDGTYMIIVGGRGKDTKYTLDLEIR